jgi:hypothetical protein
MNTSFLSKMLRYIGEYLPVVVIIIISANVSTFIRSSLSTYLLIIFTSSVFIIKRYKISNGFIIVIAFWIALNYASFLYNQTVSSFWRETSIKASLYVMFSSYILLVMSGKEFFTKLERVIFILTLVSLPFYFAELTIPSIMRTIQTPVACKYDDLGSWYVYIYYHFHIGVAAGRNAGFMWEPGAFALMIIIGIIIHLRNNELSFDRKVVVYFLALASTFSTMGYIVAFAILTLMIIKQKKYYYSIALFIFVVISAPRIYQQDFLNPKIQQHIDEGYTLQIGRNYEFDIQRINRFAAIILAIDESVKWPFGYGIIPSKHILGYYGENVYGVGAVQYTLIKWGWIGLIFFFVLIKRAVIMMGKSNKISTIELIILVLSLLIAMSSNPIDQLPIYYVIVFYPLAFPSNKFSKMLFSG